MPSNSTALVSMFILISTVIGCGQITSGREQSGGSMNGGSGGADPSTGGSTASTGGSGGSGAIPGIEIGQFCDEIAERVCAGDFQSFVLVCGPDHKWREGETCPEGTVCESAQGANFGECMNFARECADAEPGAKVCDGDEVVQCSRNNTSSYAVEECARGCLDGVCGDFKDPCDVQNGDRIDCSGDCNPDQTADCRAATCGGGIELTYWEELRLPAVKEDCFDEEPDLCKSGRWVIALGATEISYRIRAPKGWKVGLHYGSLDDLTDEQLCEAERAECVISDPAPELDRVWIVLVPVDTDEGPRNVYVEALDEGVVGTCDE